MGELGFNKIFGAILATLLGLFALHEISAIVFASNSGDHGAHGDDHHGDDHAEEKGLYDKMCGKFSLCVESAVLEGGSGATSPIEKVFDLGLALANADLSKGERAFKGQCVTCHTIEAGGAAGTGPNLHSIVGAALAGKSGFNYSGSLQAAGGQWGYSELNEWIKNPAKYVSGTSMAFAGIRKDQQRADLIAYLAANTPNAPAFPAPLPAEGTDVEEVPADLEVTPEPGIDPESLGIEATLEGGNAIETDTEVTIEEAVEIIEEPFVRKIGDFEITGNSDGAEAGLVTFIESDKEPCTDADCWFTMDRLTFESGSARIDMERSADQLNNIKAIMDAFPTMGLKIGGHTDNTGSNEINMTISQARAEAVQAWLASQGIDAARLGAEGYGPEFPVATNDTEDGRAQNRRIDVRVSQR